MVDERVAPDRCKGGDQLTSCPLALTRSSSTRRWWSARLGVMRTCMALQLRLFDSAVAVFHYACPFPSLASSSFPAFLFFWPLLHACWLNGQRPISSLWPLTRSLVVVPCHLGFPFPITSSDRCSIPPVIWVETRRTLYISSRTFHPVIYLLTTSCTIRFSTHLRLVS